jgi:TonB family protein
MKPKVIACLICCFAGFVSGQAPEPGDTNLDAIASGRQLTTAAPSPPVRYSDRETVYRVGGNVTAPRILRKVDPEYTAEARDASIEGSVKLAIEIGRDGLVHNIRVIRGLAPGLDDKAIEALNQWRFEPANKDGQPVTIEATIEVNFRLIHDASQKSRHPRLQQALGIIADIGTQVYLVNACPRIRAKPLLFWTGGDMEVWQSCTANGFFLGQVYVYTSR